MQIRNGESESSWERARNGINEQAKAALDGLKFWISPVYQGPVGTEMLADYGADVIKVERPGSGDWSRAWGPFVKGVSCRLPT